MHSRSFRSLALVLMFTIVIAGSAFADATAHVAVMKPESGTLALLGTGLVGLATLVRRHFN